MNLCSFNRQLISVLVLSIATAGMPITVQAKVVSTTDSIAASAPQSDRERVANFLLRNDVRQTLEKKGVSADAAIERVQAMTDEEVMQLADRIDHAPAGGGALGIIFAVFVILLVTDILGFTKIFPFTRSVR